MIVHVYRERESYKLFFSPNAVTLVNNKFSALREESLVSMIICFQKKCKGEVD